MKTKYDGELTDSMNRLRLLTVAQVSQLLGVSTRTIFRWVSTGELPSPVKLGGRATRFRFADIQQLIEIQAKEAR